MRRAFVPRSCAEYCLRPLLDPLTSFAPEPPQSGSSDERYGPRLMASFSVVTNPPASLRSLSVINSRTSALRIGMVVAVKSVRHRLHIRRPQLQHKIFRTRNPAENHRPRRNVLRRDPSSHPPNFFPGKRKQFGRRPAREHDGICSAKRAQRLPQTPRRKQSVIRILLRDQRNVEISREAAVLKAIVQQMHLRAKSEFGKPPCLVPIFSHNDRNLQLARDQQRFVAKLLRQAARIHQQRAPAMPPVSPRQDIELNSPRLEQLAQQQHERSLPRPARRNISDTDHRALQPARFQKPAVIERIPRLHNSAVNDGKWVQS